MLYYILSGSDIGSVLLDCVFVLVAMYISIVLHEIAHGVVAMWNGDDTAKNMGRLSLNPVKHFDLFGFLMFAVVGFGYAKPVPVNPSNFKNQKRGMFTVAIAGICMNFILAFLSSLLSVAMLSATIGASEGGATVLSAVGDFFNVLMSVNLSLAFFNILPIYPLDGFRIVETFTRYANKYCSFMRTNGQYLLLGLVLLGTVVDLLLQYCPVLPDWFSYFDILGTYIKFFNSKVGFGFLQLWSWVFFR